MPSPMESDDLAERIFTLVRSYVFARTERKCGIRWEEFKDRKITGPDGEGERIDVPLKYREARESVSTGAFLRVRACRSREDFIGYFTGTICSVPQYLQKTEFVRVSHMLLDSERWEDVKALTMLALSASSRT